MEQSKGAPGIVSGEGNDIDFAPEAMPHAGETVLTKHVQDAFNGTPLLFMLAQMQAETVILSWLTTEGCVETTARTAFNHGFAVVIAGDAVAGPDPEMHRASLHLISELIGIVADTDEIAEAAGWTS